MTWTADQSYSKGVCHHERRSKNNINDSFIQLEDPRTGQNTRHKFIEVLFIAVCAVISGCECWTEIEDYGQAKEQWLRGFLDLEGGIPSHDTLRRLFVF